MIIHTHLFCLDYSAKISQVKYLSHRKESSSDQNKNKLSQKQESFKNELELFCSDIGDSRRNAKRKNDKERERERIKNNTARAS